MYSFSIMAISLVIALFTMIIPSQTTARSSSTEGGLWKDKRISIRIDKIERSDSYPKAFRMPGYKYGPPKKGHDYLTIYFTVVRIENVYLGMPDPSAPTNPILIDSKGHKYKLANMQYKGVEYPDGFTGKKYKIVEGAAGIFMFVFPKEGRLGTLKFFYPYWKSWESKVVEYGLIEIEL